MSFSRGAAEHNVHLVGEREHGGRKAAEARVCALGDGVVWTIPVQVAIKLELVAGPKRRKGRVEADGRDLRKRESKVRYGKSGVRHMGEMGGWAKLKRMEEI